MCHLPYPILQMTIFFHGLKCVANNTKVDDTTARLGHWVAFNADDDCLIVWRHDLLDSVAKDRLHFSDVFARLNNICHIFEDWMIVLLVPMTITFTEQ